MTNSNQERTPAKENNRKAPKPVDLFNEDAVSDEAATAPAAAPLAGPDPNDLDALWAPVPLIQTRTQLMAIRAGTRPPKDKFIRVMEFSTGEGADVGAYVNCRPVYLFEYTFDGDLTAKSFYVRPGTEVANLLADKERLSEAILVLGIVRHGDPFVWELKLPNGRNESADKWARSRLELAKLAQTKWLKPVANTSGGGYDYVEPIANYDDPDWTKVTFSKAIEVACRDRIIVNMEHDAVKAALGL